MHVKTASPVSMAFQRAGGSIILSRVDIWQSTPTGWSAINSTLFQQVTKPVESHSITLPKGTYAAVFTCRVEESLNGVYDFKFDVQKNALFADKGNVNTTSSPNDSKAYKDQFVLEVV
jgi:hypothetical protein